MPTATLIPDGRGQIVCIPDEFRFDADEVQILKCGNGLLLRPKPRVVADKSSTTRSGVNRSAGKSKS